MNYPFYKTNKIQNDYLGQAKTIQSFFSVPLNPDWQKQAIQTRKLFDNKEFIGELIRQNEPAVSPEIGNNLEKLKSDKTVIVITGQQLGLLISPLYTVYKILTTIKLARKIERDHQSTSVVPVFWLEGEDHDYAEIDHLRYWDKNGKVQKVVIEEDPAEISRSISKRKLNSQIKHLLDQLGSELSETFYKKALLEKLNAIYKSGKPWLLAFREQLLDMFADYGLLTFNPADDRVKELSKPFFRQIIEKNDQLLAEYKKSSEDLIKHGYFNQVKLLDDRSYLFYNYEGQIRLPLLREENNFVINNPGQKFSKSEILTIIDQHPHWLSSSVLTRPLWQSWMLPVISYVAGPGEISHWAQLGKAFKCLGMEMPHLQPRISITAIDARRKRLLDKYQIGLNQLSGSREQFVRSRIASTLFADISGIFERLEKELGEYQQSLMSEAKQIDPTLEPVASKSFTAAMQPLKKLQNRMLKRLEEREITMKNHLESIYDFILPEGNLQERSIGAVYFQNSHGPEWIRILDESTTLDEHLHQVVVLS